MKTSSSSQTSVRSRRYHRFFALAAVSLIPIGLAIFAAFMDRGVHSVRFDELHDGMTWFEAMRVLKPTFMTQLPPPGGSTMTGMELLRHPDLNKTIFFCYQENPIVPGFTAIATFVDGRLTSKELGTPGIRDILAYWWSQVRRQ
jgi:hypothetical protein